ncbi:MULTISPECIES: hypothetical protein [unclassified Streptomyces]|uniref:hypothetical protein n=1 Tax=unclassified Streptomyces TaxID=2593676 RepID=UPI00225AFA79|nr:MULTISPECIES: hypothetical protein [unclassified Streptomyces]MCX4526024.1 hypothetical protein [Streptomyces sp. NBC_01551]MCX4543412.1 hypothetical protein [Streptomyces sp. NBC_01565]
MRSAVIALRTAGVAVALTAVSAATAPAALAGDDDRGSVSADPNPAEPGARVTLRVQGCNGHWASAKSAVFVADVDLSGRDGGRGLTGDALISSRAEPGWHDIRIKCDGKEGAVRGSIQISHHRQEPSKPYPHHTPVWPVHAGGGGMAAELAAQPDRMADAAAEKKHHGDDGPGLPHTLIGAVLAAAATLAVAGRALTLRRRRSGE